MISQLFPQFTYAMSRFLYFLIVFFFFFLFFLFGILDIMVLESFSGNLTEPKTCKLSGVLGSEKEVNTTLEIDVDHHTPQLRQSTDHEKARRNGRCNLRKSLAWDSAFFSNAGIVCALKIES